MWTRPKRDTCTRLVLPLFIYFKRLVQFFRGAIVPPVNLAFKLFALKRFGGNVNLFNEQSPVLDHFLICLSFVLSNLDSPNKFNLFSIQNFVSFLMIEPNFTMSLSRMLYLTQGFILST